MPKRARKSKNAPAAKRKKSAPAAKKSTPAAKKNARGNYSRQGRRVHRPRSRSTSVEPAVLDEEEDSEDMAIDSDDESENDGEEEENEDKEEESDDEDNGGKADGDGEEDDSWENEEARESEGEEEEEEEREGEEDTSQESASMARAVTGESKWRVKAGARVAVPKAHRHIRGRKLPYEFATISKVFVKTLMDSMPRTTFFFSSTWS
jgi:hypothetical protein